jgi:tRNA (cytidine/uridine-2'-O-)-methyltransferase
MPEPLLNIVLLHPQIPNNTGNVGRTAAVTGCRLHIVHPIAFDMSEKARRRAGLDYWHLVDCREHASWEAYLEAERPARAWLYTTASNRPHWQATFHRGDHLLFGSETDGAPKAVHDWVVQRFGEANRINLPMRPHPDARSLNLATAVACGVYEGLRQVAGADPFSLLQGLRNP